MLDEDLFKKLTSKAYQEMGIEEDIFSRGGKAVDVFSLLKIQPKFNDVGNRVLTPYEIIGVPPKFDASGNEVPIVFAIKNPIFRVSKVKDENFRFTYKKTQKEEQSIIDTLKFNYKKALFTGSEAEADMYFKLLDEASGGKAKELLADFFNYTKFYKKMKKQLLMDIFAHFFLMFVAKKRMVRNGLAKKSKLFKAYKLKSQNMDTEEYELDSSAVSDIGFQNPEMAVIQSIKINKSVSEDFETAENVSVEEEVVETESVQQTTTVSETEKESVQPEKMGLIEHIKSRINARRAKKNMKLRAHHLFASPEERYTEADEKYIAELEQKANNQGTGKEDKEDYKILT